VLRGIFEPKREEVARGWGNLHSEEFHNLYVSPNITRVMKSRMMRLVEHVARVGEMKNVLKILVCKPEGKRPLGRPTSARGMIILERILNRV